jgi:peptide/nickel transport system substrate-binding protein
MPLVRYDAALFQDQLQAPHIGDVLKRIGADHNQVGELAHLHILGTGPFVFGEHVKGQYWRGARWEKYFQPCKPYLDGYRADFMTGVAVMAGYKAAALRPSSAESRRVQRDELVEALGERVEISESPWLSELLVVFNSKRPPFDDARVRRALSLAIDRWGAAARLQGSTFLKYVGGLMRPGSSMATPESELVTIPGFAHDLAASRDHDDRLY